MTKPYEDQLIAIRKMLTHSSGEVSREGYDLLFNLWLENIDDSDFQQDLISIAAEDTNIIQEFEHRINDLVIREKITDLYLRVRLKKLSSKVKKLKADRLKEKEDFMKSEQTPTDKPEISNGKNSIEKMEARIKKIFISYSHKDESFKEDLVTALAGLQRRGIIDAWQDRRIEAGDEWLDAIGQALEECEMALLLVSSDFIASPFIQNKELARLFQRRVEDGLRVIPIIVRPCLWDSEPIIKDLQAVPKDGKAVITFSKENGDRDLAWAQIGKVIENLAQKP